MKKFNARHEWQLRVKQLLELNKGIVQLRDNRPAPFPGRYPTKIVLVTAQAPKNGAWQDRFEYVGKPTFQHWQMANKYMFNWQREAENRGWCKGIMRYFFLAEFDRKNLIAIEESEPNARVVPYARPSWYNGTLVRFYYPWSSANFVDYWNNNSRQKLHFKTLRIGKKFWKVYSAFERLQQVAHLAPHKAWAEEPGRLILT